MTWPDVGPGPTEQQGNRSGRSLVELIEDEETIVGLPWDWYLERVRPRPAVALFHWLGAA